MSIRFILFVLTVSIFSGCSQHVDRQEVSLDKYGEIRATTFNSKEYLSSFKLKGKLGNVTASEYHKRVYKHDRVYKFTLYASSVNNAYIGGPTYRAHRVSGTLAAVAKSGRILGVRDNSALALAWTHGGYGDDKSDQYLEIKKDDFPFVEFLFLRTESNRYDHTMGERRNFKKSSVGPRDINIFLENNFSTIKKSKYEIGTQFYIDGWYGIKIRRWE